MKNELVSLSLRSYHQEDMSEKCIMSVELFQNARQTMGELRDLMHETGISWDFISHEIEYANHRLSPVNKVLQSMDPYTTGLGKSLQGLSSNIF